MPLVWDAQALGKTETLSRKPALGIHPPHREDWRLPCPLGCSPPLDGRVGRASLQWGQLSLLVYLMHPLGRSFSLPSHLLVPGHSLLLEEASCSTEGVRSKQPRESILWLQLRFDSEGNLSMSASVYGGLGKELSTSNGFRIAT